MSYDRFLDRELDRVMDEQEDAEHEQEELDALLEQCAKRCGGGFEGLGRAISCYCQWDGNFILQILRAALEDANYHTLNNEIDATVKRWRGERLNPEFYKGLD